MGFDLTPETIAKIAQAVNDSRPATVYRGNVEREESPTLQDIISARGVLQVVKALDWADGDNPEPHERLTPGRRRMYSKTSGERSLNGGEILQIITRFPECDIVETLKQIELVRIRKGISKLPPSFQEELLTEGKP
jgi:hypothetical protein